MNNILLAIVLPDIRSSQNVGSIFRTADAAGINLIITCGYTPHLRVADDPRPPHVIDSNTRDIAKTALGAERAVPFMHFNSTDEAILYLHHNNYIIAALEQAECSQNLFSYEPIDHIAILLGNETDGVQSDVLKKCDLILEIPMMGVKESLNVSVAAGIAMYHLRTPYKKLD